MANEAFAPTKIDQLLRNTDWRPTDGLSQYLRIPAG